jgi:hypothetical protein
VENRSWPEEEEAFVRSNAARNLLLNRALHENDHGQRLYLENFSNMSPAAGSSGPARPPAGPRMLQAPTRFRRAADETARTVDEVCMPELTALARETLATGATEDAVVVSMARELGLQRLRAARLGAAQKGPDVG